MCTKRRNYSTSDLCAFSITVICVFLLLFYIKEELGVRQSDKSQQIVASHSTAKYVYATEAPF